MVERYARVEMKKLWDMNAKYQAWLDVEIAAVKAWNKLGDRKSTRLNSSH